MIEKYSYEYWLHHFEYVMGYKEKLDIDTSNTQWTKRDLIKILNGKFPYGWTGLNGAKALIQFIKIYHPEKLQDTVELMIQYIEDLQLTKNKPLTTIYNFYLSERADNKS